VLYQAELYPEICLDPLPERAQKGNMFDLKERWPLGLGETRWWLPVAAMLAVLALAFAFDGELSAWAQGWPESVRGALEQITPYGESDWILIPAGALLILTAAVAAFVRWRLMRTLLWQFSALYGFILVGVGLPSLVATLLKRAIGRGRPQYFDQQGSLSFSPNWFDWTYQSLPSGHATTAFALATVIGFVSPRWFYPGLAIATAIAASRVSMGVHYPSDIVAGAILGVLGAYLARIIFAGRRWMFEPAPDGTISARPMSSLRRYLRLRRRGSAPAPQTSRP
jgi:membrane-associated phospholipid phosphatase